jgi:hypothetical protein
VLHLQEIVRGPLDMLADLMTMRGSIKKRSQDEHVKRALEKGRPLLCSFLHGRQSTLQFGRNGRRSTIGCQERDLRLIIK